MRIVLLTVLLCFVSLQTAWAAGADKKKSEYAAAGTIGSGEVKGIVYLACDKDDRILALLNSGKVRIYGKDGAFVSEFSCELETPKAIATDDKGTIYVIGITDQPPATDKKGGKKSAPQPPANPKDPDFTVICKKFDATGALQQEKVLEDARNISSAAISKGKLLIADRKAFAVTAYDPDTGKKKESVGKNLRLCCGIFGFAVGKGGDILIANLGAFRVDRYDSKGTFEKSFGTRGEGEANFHGCCNPVNILELSDGRLLTVEKDTTRVKIYDSKGEKCLQVLTDVQELVNGCSYVPMTADSEGNVFLANVRGGAIVKCAPKSE